MNITNENVTMANIIKRMEKIIMENLNINYKGNMCENFTKCGMCLDFGNYELIEDELIEEVKEFNGDIFVISDGKFIKGLTANEFLVYYAFLGISRHNNNGQHYIYNNDLNFVKLEEELKLSGRYENTIMSRKTMKSTFDELVKKKVFTLVTLDNGDEVYYIVQTKEYLFTRMPKETYKAFSKTLSGNALKIYCFIKGNLDNIKANGKDILYMNRSTIAQSCGITNKKGEVTIKQLDLVGTILKTLYSFDIIDYALKTKVVDGKLVGRYEFYGVKTELKKQKR
ncbi:hypothetical protein [Terrisporobacter vanillatitrophus]|uniref:hypothetical protein n=1 Tax=Terrisporobacter vanillatitrophus TaxID=3058402 RepID=UPI003366BD3F